MTITLNKKELSEIKRKLLEILRNDQLLRKTSGIPQTSIEAMDRVHIASLKKIVKYLKGWPTISKVGKKASKAAWIVAQHSRDLEFQRTCLRLMKKDVSDVNLSNCAYLIDIIGINTGKGQVYGTCLKTERNEEGKLVTEIPHLRFPKSIDRLRKKAGLLPLKDYIKIANNNFEKYLEKREL